MPQNEDYDGYTPEEIANLVQENDELRSGLYWANKAQDDLERERDEARRECARQRAGRQQIAGHLKDAVELLQRGSDLADDIGLDIGWMMDVEEFIKEHRAGE